MTQIAIVLVALGLIALIWGAIQKYKAGRLAKTPFVGTGDAASRGAQLAGPKGALSTQGAVRVSQPLRSPVTGTECLYYELEVIGRWKDGDSTEKKTYVEDKRAAELFLDDGSGPLLVDASGGGDFDGLKQTFDETKKEGLLADLKGALGRGEPIQFGQYAFQNPVNSRANEFQCVERVMPLASELYANGKLENGQLGSPNWASLILSTKGRDDLLGGTAKAAKGFLLGGAAAAAAGTVLGVVASFV